jgi:hypothetical protein
MRIVCAEARATTENRGHGRSHLYPPAPRVHEIATCVSLAFAHPAPAQGDFETRKRLARRPLPMCVLNTAAKTLRCK